MEAADNGPRLSLAWAISRATRSATSSELLSSAAWSASPIFSASCTSMRLQRSMGGVAGQRGAAREQGMQVGQQRQHRRHFEGVSIHSIHKIPSVVSGLACQCR